MKTLYLDCGMGAAGDMLTAALLELLPDPDAFIDELNNIGIPRVVFKKSSAQKCGVIGTHVSVLADGKKESEPAEHPHTHEEHHEHSNMEKIEAVISGLHVSEKVKTDVRAVYSLIAEAESHVHGCPVPEVHFHEVGTLDAIADVTAVCLLMERIAPDSVIASPVHVGSGTVRCAHGILPVPAPATAYILRDVPVYSGEIKGELCTPTGAALLKRFATSFGPQPLMTVASVGAYVSARWKMRRMAVERPSIAPKASLELSGISRASWSGQKMRCVLPIWNSAPGLRKALAMRMPWT